MPRRTPRPFTDPEETAIHTRELRKLFEQHNVLLSQQVAQNELLHKRMTAMQNEFYKLRSATVKAMSEILQYLDDPNAKEYAKAVRRDARTAVSHAYNKPDNH